MFGVLPFEGPCKIKLTPQFGDYEASKQARNKCARVTALVICYPCKIIPIPGVGIL